jgi:hypothetical protein
LSRGAGNHLLQQGVEIDDVEEVDLHVVLRHLVKYLL